MGFYRREGTGMLSADAERASASHAESEWHVCGRRCHAGGLALFFSTCSLLSEAFVLLVLQEVAGHPPALACCGARAYASVCAHVQGLVQVLCLVRPGLPPGKTLAFARFVQIDDRAWIRSMSRHFWYGNSTDAETLQVGSFGFLCAARFSSRAFAVLSSSHDQRMVRVVLRCTAKNSSVCCLVRHQAALLL